MNLRSVILTVLTEAAEPPAKAMRTEWSQIAKHHKAKVILMSSPWRWAKPGVEVAYIGTDERQAGHASKAMRAITNLADKHKVKLILNPCPIGVKKDDRPHLSQPELEEWYGRHGFVQSEHDQYYMVRHPR